MSPVIVGNIDIAMLSFWAFCLFFVGLVLYLNQESRREGYPLEEERDGRLFTMPLLDVARPKEFRLPHGLGSAYAPPNKPRDPVDLKAVKAWGAGGAPLVPTGNPLVDGLGAAAWAERDRRPDLDFEGHPRIVPLNLLGGVSVDRADADPRGMTVLGLDGATAGTVAELWVDRADRLVRYLQVTLTSGRDVLVPFNDAVVKGRRRVVEVDAVTAAQFADAPAIERPDQITLYEEERIMAYFGGGYLYATPDRQEPLV
jgi:photosynthetic reaction center H subunit